MTHIETHSVDEWAGQLKTDYLTIERLQNTKPFIDPVRNNMAITNSKLQFIQSLVVELWRECVR